MISDIERNERLRTLSSARRLRYSFMLALAVTGIFLLSVFCAILLAVIVTALVTASPLNVDNILVLALPILIGFLIAISFSGNPSKASIPAGLSLGGLAKRAARKGVINGLVVGIGFGLFWAFVLQLNAVFYGIWGEELRVSVIAYYVGMLPVALMPSVALFKAVTSVIDLIVLRAVSA